MLKSKFLFAKIYSLPRFLKAHSLFLGLLVFLVFFSSCEKLEERPVITEVVVEEKFNRDSFLQAVNKASLEYAAEIKKSKKHLNFRTVYDSDIMIHSYIERIASGLNTTENYFKLIPENTWNDPYQGNVFEQEAILDKSIISPRLNMHLEQFEIQINEIAERYEKDQLSENQVKNELRSASRSIGSNIGSDLYLPTQDRGDFSEIFYTLETATDDIALVLSDSALTNAFFSNRMVRALVRTILVAAVTAAIIYTGGLAVGIIKLKSGIAIAHKAGLVALTKKVSIGSSGKLYAGLYFGLGKGMIEATQKWEKPWEGISKEAKYAIKAVW